MRCPRCGHDNEPEAAFCEDCGARLEVGCPACGRPVRPGAKFCRSCGAALTGASGAAPPAPSVPAGSSRASLGPDAYTPPHLAEKILRSKAALEGERKRVTVLFADIQGSTALLAGVDPEEARRLLDPILERLMEAVHHYEGTVNQVLGDGIMALFGAPIAHEDHALRACYAALRMQAAMRRHAEDLRRTQGVVLQVRVGLNSGEVVVRAIGNDLHMDYSAVGQTTHLAARMEQLATPGTILIAPDTARLAEGYVQVKSLGPFTIKGLQESLEVFEVVGVGPARTRLQVAAARGLTKFVGREAELAQLRQALDRAARGHGQAVAVVGEPGVGKSRLFHEFKRSRGVESCLVLETVSASYGKASAYFPLIELLRGYFHVDDRDDTRRILEKVTGKVLTLERSLEESVPLLLALLAVGGQAPEASRLDPKVRRARTLEALKRLLIRESEVQPVVLIFEDLHWVDDETRGFLDLLVEGLPGAPLLLLVNHRPELKQAWSPRSYSTQMWLEPLAPENAGDLLGALLGSDPGLTSLKSLLLARTGGNPLFLEEGVRDLVETGALVGERGAYRATRDIATVQVPATVQAIIAARIDRLAPEDKAVLQLAAVIGEEIPLPLLGRVAEEPEEALRPRLGRLQEAEFLYEARLFPEIAYTFRHGLTREVAYEGLLAERRRAVHGRIAAAIEALYPDRLAEHTEALAQHYQRHQDWQRAFGYLVTAGDKASAAYANEAAIAFYTQALEAAARAPSPAGGRATEVRLKRGTVFHTLVDIGAALQDFERALEEARQAGDRRMEGEALYKLSAAHWFRHDVGRALGCAEEARAIAEETGAQRVLGGSLFVLGRLHMVRGALAEAEPLAVMSVRVAQAIGDLGLEAGALGQLGAVQRHQGRTHEALTSLDRSLNLARDTHDLLSVANGLYRLACVHGDRGEYGRAMAAAEEARRLGEAHGERYYVPRALNVLGGTYGEVGAYEPAVEQNRKAEEMARAVGEPMGEVSCNSFLDLARHHLAQGEEARGAEYLEEVWKVVRDPGSDPWMQWRYKNRLLYMLGTFWLGRGDAAKAWGFAEDSLRLAEQTGAQKNIARSHLLRGELLASGGKLTEAEAALRFALEVARRTAHRPLAWQIRAALGRVLEREGKRDEAALEDREALALIEAIATDVPPGDLRTSFLNLPAIQTIRERLDALPRA